jgi:N-hydroxyarylamine O-acetyltransferase
MSTGEGAVQRCEIVREYLRAPDLQDRELNFEFLIDLVGRHAATFAFSSVGCRLGEDLPLDFESLFRRIVVLRRGGYCFEQNGLLYEVLEELGFSPELYLARVIYDQDIHPGLTHRISIVEHDGLRYVLDVGFGSLGPRIPVLMSESESKDGGKVFRVAERNPGEYHMQVFKDGAFFSLYRFELARYGPADCKLGHFYSHQHPDAAFVNHLVVSLILPDETRSLRDLEYWVISESGTQATQIREPEQLRQILVDELRVQVTEAEGRRLYEGLAT